MDPRDAQTVMHNAVCVATRGEGIAVGLDPLIKRARAGGTLTPDETLLVLESFQELTRLVIAQPLLVATLELRAAAPGVDHAPVPVDATPPPAPAPVVVAPVGRWARLVRYLRMWRRWLGRGQ